MALDPTLAEVLNAWLDSRMGDLHVAMPGKVTSYDPDTQTAEVEPQIKQALLKPDGGRENIALPKIPNVPVHWPRAGGCYLHFPMAAGDYVLLIFNEAAIATWRSTGEVSPAGDLERHGLSYPYALPGGWPDSGAFGTPGPVIVVPSALTVCGEGADASAQPVAGATKTDADFEAIKSACTTLASALTTWLGLFPSDPVAPTMTVVTPGAATLATAVGAFSTAIAAVNTATVGMAKLKAGD
jgi:hypothetical protein